MIILFYIIYSYSHSNMSEESRVKTPTLDRNDFQAIINANRDILVFKFGADWCGPCKRSKPLIYKLAEEMPENVTVFDIDVDDSFDLYAWMKTKKQVNGIPVLLAYYRDNKTFAPSYSYTGGDENGITDFFNVVRKAASM